MTATIIKDLFQNFVHIGHKADRWNPKMKPFLFTKKDGVHVFDLEKTAAGLEKAKKFISEAKLKNEKILFVGTKPQVSIEIQSQVAPTNHFYVDQKWIPGLLTNFNELRKRIDHYLNLKSQFESGEIKKYTKKEVAKFKKDLEKLDISYRGVAEMRKKPKAVVVLDAVTDHLAIAEAKNANLPIVAIVDANADPTGIDFPIPGNDDSIKSIRFLLKSLLESLK